MFGKVFGSTKRRIGLALMVALLLVALPAAAFAGKAGAPFTANGIVYLTDPGEVELDVEGKSGIIKQETEDEQIQGTIVVDGDGWSLDGQTLLVVVSHDSKVLYDLKANPGLWTIKHGKSQEKVDLYLLSGEKVFTGQSKAGLTGWFDQSVFSPTGGCSDADNASYALKGQMMDIGTIILEGVGSYAGQSADGDWAAGLEARCGVMGPLPFPILAGQVSMSGMHFSKN